MSGQQADTVRLTEAEKDTLIVGANSRLISLVSVVEAIVADRVAAARADERERMQHVLGGDFDWIADALGILDRLHHRASEVSRSYWSPKPEHALTDRQRNDRVHSILGGLPSVAIGLRALRAALTPPAQSDALSGRS